MTMTNLTLINDTLYPIVEKAGAYAHFQPLSGQSNNCGQGLEGVILTLGNCYIDFFCFLPLLSYYESKIAKFLKESEMLPKNLKTVNQKCKIV